MGNPSSLEEVKNHLRQYASWTRISKYCRSDPKYVKNELNENLEREWFHLFVDGKPRSLCSVSKMSKVLPLLAITSSCQ